jgi:hypothetical protein
MYTKEELKKLKETQKDKGSKSSNVLYPQRSLNKKQRKQQLQVMM